jgi:mono/diheme cytochrome c family protein
MIQRRGESAHEAFVHQTETRADFGVCPVGSRSFLHCFGRLEGGGMRLVGSNISSFWLTAVLMAQIPLTTISSQAALEYNRDIRAILSENCFSCHGPDVAGRKADLRLDRFEDAIALRQQNKQVIVPGQPDQSELLRRVLTQDADDVMPPPKTHKKLNDAQKELLRQWVAEGAKYQPHWAYMKVIRPAVPRAKDSRWTKNPIDNFILHSLEAKNIKPSSEARKRTLLRRLSLDLTGLPPTLEALKEFIKDNSPKAYERQVDLLLASPHFGERMALSWLDVVRYADTVGYHGDDNQNVFPYRDYVIDAFNHNKSFAQFTIEQIAGDLLPDATTEQQVASCFNRLNLMTREGGTQQKEYLAKYHADRARTVASAWLGSTMGCAECHDHKFDPFSAKDFYSMEAFFADIKQWGVYQDYPSYTPNPELKGFTDDHPFPPEIEVENRYLQHRRENLLGQIEALAASRMATIKANESQQAAFQEWCQAVSEFLKQNPTGWFAPRPGVTFNEKQTNVLIAKNCIISENGTISLGGKVKDSIQIVLPVSGWVAAVRLEVFRQANIEEKQGEQKQKSASIALTAALRTSAGIENKISFQHAEADHKATRYSLGSPTIGVKDLWKLSTEYEKQTAVWLLDEPFKAKSGDSLVLNLRVPVAVFVRASISPLAAREPLNAGSVSASLGKSLAKARLNKELNITYLFSTGWDTNAFVRIKALERQVRECRNGRGFVMVTEKREPMTIRVLPRGNWQDETGEIVQPATPHFLPQLANPENRLLNRIDLAHWLVSRDNPLTARTFVNRAWKQLFGTGISAVVDDLGAQGEWPVHPELLDWLASEFMDRGWDIKHVMKLMVMSATYRQDSNVRQDLKDLDPNNRLVGFQSPRRLEAEFVRDNALTISGLLAPDIGGPSVHPYQPAGYYANIQFPNRDYYPDKDERQYRRGIYTHWQRSFLHPMMANFDAPAREECTANRTVSNTPQQGLTLLNDPTFVEAARVFAEKLLQKPKQTDGQRIDLAYETALARPVKDNEKSSLLIFLAEQRAHYRTNIKEAEKLLRVGIAPEVQNIDKVELAAWANLCRVVLNLHETITRY